MNFRKPDNTTDLIDSIINSENGKVQKYVLERKRKEKEFMEKKENIKKKTLMAPKLNQMFIINKNDDDKLISETVGLRTVYEYKKIKDEIYNKKGSKNLSQNLEENKHKKSRNFNLSFCTDEENDEEQDEEEIERKAMENEETYDKLNSNLNENILENKVKNDKTPLQNEIKNDKNCIEDNIDNDIKDNMRNEIKNEKNDIKYEKKNYIKKIMKDPTVNTSFLKDKERDEQIELKKKELRELYFKLENEEKEKTIEITYSYYDGCGHRRKISVKQKTTIGQFINKCVENLKSEFIQLRSASCETLIFVKEDIILPNYLTFYELIKNKAQGKTGPLFAFDAVENLSGITDIRKEKTDTHAGKLVEKKWYEKNKHIFPACKWEIYKPLKTYTTSYNDLFNSFI